MKKKFATLASQSGDTDTLISVFHELDNTDKESLLSQIVKEHDEYEQRKSEFWITQLILLLLWVIRLAAIIIAVVVVIHIYLTTGEAATAGVKSISHMSKMVDILLQ